MVFSPILQVCIHHQNKNVTTFVLIFRNKTQQYPLKVCVICRYGQNIFPNPLVSHQQTRRWTFFQWRILPEDLFTESLCVKSQIPQLWIVVYFLRFIRACPFLQLCAVWFFSSAVANIVSVQIFVHFSLFIFHFIITRYWRCGLVHVTSVGSSPLGAMLKLLTNKKKFAE